MDEVYESVETLALLGDASLTIEDRAWSVAFPDATASSTIPFKSVPYSERKLIPVDFKAGGFDGSRSRARSRARDNRWQDNY